MALSACLHGVLAGRRRGVAAPRMYVQHEALSEHACVCYAPAQVVGRVHIGKEVLETISELSVTHDDTPLHKITVSAHTWMPHLERCAGCAALLNMRVHVARTCAWASAAQPHASSCMSTW